MLQSRIVGRRHYEVGREVRKTLATYEELKDIIAMLGLEENCFSGKTSGALSYTALLYN